MLASWRFIVGVAVFVNGLASLGVAAEANWPAWRGPLGIGIAANTGVPLKWSATENIRWKTPLELPGNSTPIVWEKRIFLTTASPNGDKRSLVCFDRETGKQLWQRDVAAPEKELTHDTNPYAAASPVTDGERVIVWHGTAGVFAYGLDGKELWKKDLGKFTHIWDYAASPVIVGSNVIVSAGPGVRCLLVALDKKSGDEVWRRELPEAQSKDEKEYVGSWSTPVVHTHAGRQQLLLSLPKALRSFDPASGKDMWTCRGLGPLAYTSVLASGDVAVAMSGFHGPALACRVDGTGDVTDTHRLWLQTEKNPQRVGSGVIVGDHVYILNENGVAWCMELRSGKRLWEKRISPTSWCSMTLVDGRLYVANVQGETLVLKPNPNQCEILAENKLDGAITRASHAFAGKQIVMRTYKALWCVEER